MSKMTWALLVGLFAGRTLLAILNDTKTSIKDSIWHRLITLIGLVCCDFDNTALPNVFGVRNTELNACNCVSHFITTYLYVYILPFFNRPLVLMFFAKMHPVRPSHAQSSDQIPSLPNLSSYGQTPHHDVV